MQTGNVTFSQRELPRQRPHLLICNQTIVWYTLFITVQTFALSSVLMLDLVCLEYLQDFSLHLTSCPVAYELPC